MTQTDITFFSQTVKNAEPEEKPEVTRRDRRAERELRSSPDDNRQCDCGKHVSAEWIRVMSDDGSNEVHACPECASTPELLAGAAARGRTENKSAQRRQPSQQGREAFKQGPEALK